MMWDVLISVTMQEYCFSGPVQESCACPEWDAAKLFTFHVSPRWRSWWENCGTVCLLQVFRHYKCQKKGKWDTYFSVFGAEIPPLHNFTSHVFSYLQPWQQKSLELFSKLHSTLCVTGKTGNQAFVRSRWHQKTPCFICLKQSYLDAFTCPHVGLCRSSEQIGKQHKRSAGEVPAGCHNMLVCRRTSVAQSPCLISLRLPLLFFLSCSHSHFTSITCSFRCLYHLLSSILSVPDTQSQPAGLSVCVSFSLFLSGIPPFLPHTSTSFSFTLKYVLVGCVSCTNASDDCILHPQCNNKAGVLLPHPFSSPCFLPFVPQKWGIAAVNSTSREGQEKAIQKQDKIAFFIC